MESKLRQRTSRTAQWHQPLVGSLRPEKVNWRAIAFGLTRYPKAATLALVGSWTLLALAIWVATILAIIGGVVGFLGAGSVANSYVPGSGSAAGLVGGAVGLLGGFALGLGAIMGTNIGIAALRIAVALVCGAILAAAATVFLILIEPFLMYFHGYRPPSDREELVLAPVLRTVASAMQLTAVPQILISDTRTPGAWTHTGHVVLTKRLLDLPSNQLGGILAHELAHWGLADSIGLLFVSMCGLPLLVTTNVLAYFAGKTRAPLVALIGSLLVWPYLVIGKLLMQPVLAMEGRRHEYVADSAAVAAGYGQGLYLALEQMRPFERPRSGWEHVLLATHPPMEYRLEAIENWLNDPDAPVQHVAVPHVAGTPT